MNELGPAKFSFLGQSVTTWLPLASSCVDRIVVFLHGSGDTGAGVSSWIESLLKKEEVGNGTVVIFPR